MAAGTRANISLRISLTGDNKASGAVDAAGKSVKALEAAGGKLGAALAEATGKGMKGFMDLGSGAAGALAKFGLAAQGIKSIASGVKELGEAIKEGAAAGDRMDILRSQVAGVDDIISRVKESTAGMLPEEDITRAIAQFRQFQIPVEAIDETLRQVAATSIRTGEDISTMTESVISGIARESAMRLDNLGVLLDANQVKKDYAKTLGIEAAALTQAESKTAILTEATKQMTAANEGFNLEASRTASIERLSTAVDDMWTGIKTGLADVAVGFLEWVGVIPERIIPAEQAVADYNAAMEVYSAVTGRATVETIDYGQEVEIAADMLARLNAELGRMPSNQEAARLEAERLKLRQQEVQEVLRLSAELQVARENEQALAHFVKLGVDFKYQLNDAERETLRLIDELHDARIRIGETDEQALANVVEQNKQKEEQARLEREKLGDLTSIVESQKHLLDLQGGATEAELQLRDVKKEISSLNKESIVDMQRMVQLLEQQRALQSLIAASSAMLGGFSRGAAAGRRRGGGGGRSKSAEAESMADIVSLEEARLKAAGKLTGEMQEQLEIAKLNAKLDKISADLSAKKITAGKAAVLMQKEEYDLARKIADIRAQEAADRAQMYEDGIAGARAEFEARQALREQLLPTSAGDQRRALIQEGLDTSAISAEEGAGLRADLADEEAQAARLEQYRLMEAALDGLGAAGQRAAASTDETLQAFGRLAESLQTYSDDITGVIEQFAAAQEKGASAAVGATASAIAVSGKLAAAFVDDEQTKSAIMGAVELAAGIAAFAYEDYVGGALHLVASGLYFAAAGQAGSSGAGAAAAGSSGSRRNTPQQTPQSERGYKVEIHVNSPAAIVGGTMQEAAAQLGNAVRAADGTGFEDAA